MECGNDASLGAENVSEADGFHRSARAAPTQEREFRHSFGGTHNAARVDGFIRGNHYESSNTMRARCLRQEICAERIILDGGDRIVLHQRNVFEGCRVNDDLRLMLFKYFGEERGIADVSENRNPDSGAGNIAELELDLVEIEFRMIQQNERTRSLPDDRSGQRGSDRAARAGQ